MVIHNAGLNSTSQHLAYKLTIDTLFFELQKSLLLDKCHHFSWIPEESTETVHTLQSRYQKTLLFFFAHTCIMCHAAEGNRSGCPVTDKLDWLLSAVETLSGLQPCRWWIWTCSWPWCTVSCPERPASGWSGAAGRCWCSNAELGSGPRWLPGRPVWHTCQMACPLLNQDHEHI